MDYRHENLTVKKTSLKLWRWLTGVWHWLIEPSPSIVEPERRLQARLLMAMLLVLIILVGLGAFAVINFGSDLLQAAAERDKSKPAY